MIPLRSLSLLFLSLLVPGIILAEDFVCGNTTKLHQYTHAVDPTKVPNCPPAFTQSQIPEAEIPAQLTLYTTVPKRHLKVVDGLMMEMTQAEKDAVDAPLIEEGNRHQELLAETEDPALCGLEELALVTQQMTAVRTQIQGDIDVLTLDLPGLQTELGQMFDKVMATLDKLARCLLAARETRQ